MNNELQDKSILMQQRAFDMFPLHAGDAKDIQDPFPMYSYERAASIFWCGFIDELYARGLDCSQVEWLLSSKNMRWMFDSNESKLEFIAKSFVDCEMIKRALEASK